MTGWGIYHGGVPGLRVGEIIEPGFRRRQHVDCPWCEARAAGGAFMGMDRPSGRTDRVYATSNRLYAKFYASLWGRGDLYRVTAIGELEPSQEDSIPSVTAAAFRVASVYDRAVLLTASERRRLHREWAAADLAHDRMRMRVQS